MKNLIKILVLISGKGHITVQTISPGFVKTPLTDKNDFDMPMRIEAETAAKIMLKGIQAGKKNIQFPFLFALLLTTLSLLPERIKARLCQRVKQ